jgi:diacylglycerol O-acyltransferase / wax synthase
MDDNVEGDAPLDWGGPRELTPFETLMWRADGDPMMRSTMMAVEVLDTLPAWDRLVEAHEWAVRMAPRFRDRVVDRLGVLGTPVWVQDPRMDLHYHLRRVRLPESGGWSALWTLAEQLAMTPFDRARPPWEGTLVEGLPGGKAAYLFKLHHVLTDGLGLTELLSQIHSRQRARSPRKPQPAARVVAAPSLVEQVGRQLRSDLGTLAPVVRGGGALLRNGIRRPTKFVGDAVRYVESARRVLSPPAIRGLPLLSERGPSWRFVALSVEFADLRAAAKSAGGSLNDAFLAALLAAFRVYAEDRGEPLEAGATMPISVPVSVRREGDDGGGNHIAPARLAGPVGMTDPPARMNRVGELMRAARDEPALESAEFVAPVLARLPAALLVRIAGSTTSSNDLQASNVPGIREEVYVAGAKIEQIYPFAPLPGCAAMVSMYTYNGMCFVGANVDAAAIKDTALFGRCLARGFAEVLQEVEHAAAPTVLM